MMLKEKDIEVNKVSQKVQDQVRCQVSEGKEQRRGKNEERSTPKTATNDGF